MDQSIIVIFVSIINMPIWCGPWSVEVVLDDGGWRWRYSKLAARRGGRVGGGSGGGGDGHGRSSKLISS